MSKFFNVTGSTGVTVELITPTEDNGGIKSITLTNVHATADATVTVFIQDDPSTGATSTYNIISTIAIPSDTALILDTIPAFPDDFGLYITVGSSDTVDVAVDN